MKSIFYSISLGLLVFVIAFTLLNHSFQETEVISSIETSSNQTEIQNLHHQSNVQSDDILESELEIVKTSTNPKSDKKGIVPNTVEIPAINIKAQINPVGLTETGGMKVPDNIMEVGWFEPGTLPGDVGNAVIAGHVDGVSGPGVFYNLKKLSVGDQIFIYGKGGKALTFTVEKIVSYPAEDAPINEIFGPTNGKSMNLITCTGPFDRESGYTDRLVVYTNLTSDTVE
ncbi:class F sortase [Filobacillus milosensis]|uniref:Class F sortase n=1 Tax=Filobacillus milosensis TaxID=94137 RepID=A0A4Y8IBL4_9BACI|nr:class F sortase [Filobacillus milosensis]TFB13373.1 class F sortase [Filobacillus milosensis]